MTGLIDFSQDPAANDVAAPPILWTEGMAAKAVNDSARAMMAALANWYADTTGAPSATGAASGLLSISTAQGVTLSKPFELSFTVDAANLGPLNMAVDGLSTRPLQRPGNLSVGPGDVVPGVVYKCRWHPGIGRYILISPVPESPGRVAPFATVAAVPSGWVICDGRALSRAAYAALFGVLGTTYGNTDATNFRVPDLRGRTLFGADDQGGTAANRLSGAGGIDGALGTAGGTETTTLTVAQMPVHKHTGSTGAAGARPATTTGDAGAVAARTTGSAGAHSHTGTTDSAGGHSHSGSTSTAGSHVHNQQYERLTLYGTGGQLSAVTQLFPPGTNSVATSDASGDHSHTFTTNAVAGHTHGLTTDSVSAHAHSIPAVDDHSHSVPAVPDHTHTLTLADAGGGGAHPNLPPGLCLIFAIKA